MKWQAMWAAFLAMTILRSASAGWSTKQLQVLDLSVVESRGAIGKLRGAIPDAVSSWSKMMHLKMHNQALRGPIPAAFRSVTALELLDLSGPDPGRGEGKLRGAIPDAVGSWSKMTYLEMSYQVFSGPIPHAVSSLTALEHLGLSGPSDGVGALRGAIPFAVGFWSRMTDLWIVGQPLSGLIPDVFWSLATLKVLVLEGCRGCRSPSRLSGAIPDAVGTWSKTTILSMSHHDLSGLIPHAIGSFTAQLKSFYVVVNDLRGSIPHVVGSLTSLEDLSVSVNRLSGPIPHAVGSMAALLTLEVHENRLRGPIPDAIVSLRLRGRFSVSENSLSGTIPHVVGSLTMLVLAYANQNCLRGPIPHAIGSMLKLLHLSVDQNSLRGTIPHVVASLLVLNSFSAPDNALSGSIPSGLFILSDGLRMFVNIRHNRLTGTLPNIQTVVLLLASGNLLDGNLPNTVNSGLTVMDVSGVQGRSGGLSGYLPPTLCQASKLKMLTMANHQLSGGIPSFTSTLMFLDLHSNLLKVLSDSDIADDTSRTTILLHDNLLSCYVPAFGNATVHMSITAIGNRLRYPQRDFPLWVLEHERDPLLWISGTDGMSLVQKISGAACLFGLVVASKFGTVQLLTALSGWQVGPRTHLWVVNVSSHVHTRMEMESAVAAVFIVFLLSWDLYVCPQTLALLSSCLRSSALIRTWVFLSWYKLCFHSLAVEHLTMEGEKQKKKWTAKILRKRLLLWLPWCILTGVLSTLAVLYQVAKSIPGSLPAGKIWSLGLNACIGATQGCISNLIVPYLASKMTWHKHAFTTVSSLLMNCVIPAVVVIYLDTGCLGRWASWWKTCRSNSQLFQRHVLCQPPIIMHDCGMSDYHRLDFMVVRASDICDPHISWTLTSMSRCIHITLLRLQEVWLAKFVTTGLVMPGVNFMRDNLPTESDAVVGNLGIYMTYALMSAGHLPLMNFILFLAFLGEGLVAMMAWVRERFEAKYVEDVAAPVVKMARMLSFMVHLAAVAGDLHTLAFASAYIIFMRIMTKSIGMRSVAE